MTEAEPYLEQTLAAACRQAFDDGQTLEQICSAVYHRAHAFGCEATIGVQEVYSTNMPSFPGQTVMSALLLVDLRPMSRSLGQTSHSKPHRVE